jgi:hypothetical protein
LFGTPADLFWRRAFFIWKDRNYLSKILKLNIMKTLKCISVILILFTLFSLNEALGQWITVGTDIHNSNTGNVGIGNNPPATLLHVGKNMTEPTIRVQNFGGTGGATFQMMDNASGADWKFKATSTGGFKIRDHANLLDVIVVEPNSEANSIYIDADGNVAMGQSTTSGHGLNVINFTPGKAAVQGLNQSGTTLYASGMLGVLDAGVMGTPLGSSNLGVFGYIPVFGAGTYGHAVAGWNNDDAAQNFGGTFMTDGTPAGYSFNYGVYGSAMHATQNYAGYFSGRVLVYGWWDGTVANDYLATVLTATVQHTVPEDTKAIEGISTPAGGYGIGVYGNGGHQGVYGTATGGATNWAAYFDGSTYISNDLRIGTTTQATGYSLSVNGKVVCTEVLVEALASWPDYVFADDYDLMSLKELEENIEKNNHLPGLPSAAEIADNGILLGNMQTKLLEKVEELTLYTIEQSKLISNQGEIISELQKKLENLEKGNARFRKSKKAND